MKILSKILLVAAIGNRYRRLYNCKNKYQTEDATQNTEDRHLSGFNSVSVAGSFDVVITQGSTESVKVQAPSDIINRIITEVEGSTLKIYTKNDNDWHLVDGGHKKIMIYVSIKDVNAVSLSGSGDVSFREGLRGIF
jgi:ribosomal silencing factor RsfS